MGEYDANIAQYIPGTLELAYQGMLENIKTIHLTKTLKPLIFNCYLTKTFIQT